MKKTYFGFLMPILLLVVIVAAGSDQPDLKVHEWGTFTSIAGENGADLTWRPFGGPSDLPCFVDRYRNFKGILSGTVRMETPVLYFYGARESTANVKVQFRNGIITEWFPKAATGQANELVEWRGVKISPTLAPAFPVELGQSHYYAARDTDAVPLQVGSQTEKFLFYRGVGTFSLPISAKLTASGELEVKNLAGDPVGGLILFENRGGKVRYHFAGTLGNETTLGVQLLKSDDKLAALAADLEGILVAQGLYPKEAQAMIETWRDSWFEEGTRLLYIVPRRAIDSILPLDIRPAPAQVARVFVGRMEVITPAIQEDVKQAIANNDRRTLEKYGRFLEPIARRLGAKSALLDSVAEVYVARASSCDR